MMAKSGHCIGTRAEDNALHAAAEKPLTYDEIYRNLDGVFAMQVAMTTPLKKQKGERDTEFVKRIVAKYVTAAQN